MWSLAGLKEVLEPISPLADAKERLEEADEARSGGGPLAMDNPDPALSAASNRVFTALRRIAFAAVKKFRDEGAGDYGAFEAMLVAEAGRLCPWGREAVAVAERSAVKVATWTWRNWRDRSRQPKHATAGARSAARAEAARDGNRKRARGTVEKLAAAFMELREKKGGRVTRTATAKLAGVCEDTARNRWGETLEMVRANVDNPRFRSSPVKKTEALPGEAQAGWEATGIQPSPLLPHCPSPSALRQPAPLAEVLRETAVAPEPVGEPQPDTDRGARQTIGVSPICPETAAARVSAGGSAPEALSGSSAASAESGLPDAATAPRPRAVKPDIPAFLLLRRKQAPAQSGDVPPCQGGPAALTRGPAADRPACPGALMVLPAHVAVSVVGKAARRTRPRTHR